MDSTEKKKNLCGASEMHEGLGESPGRDENQSLPGYGWEALCLYTYLFEL